MKPMSGVKDVFQIITNQCFEGVPEGFLFCREGHGQYDGKQPAKLKASLYVTGFLEAHGPLAIIWKQTTCNAGPLKCVISHSLMGPVSPYTKTN
jgi:hypothetical protein